MEFTQKKRIKGKTVQHHKEWYDETKQYRIIWRDEVFGVEVQKGFSACVRCVRSPDDSFVYWGFAGRRGLYKTRKAAQEACELNHKVWSKFLTIDGRDKVTQVRDLRHRSLVGKGKDAFPMMTDLPVWVATKSPPRLLEILCTNVKDRKGSRSMTGSDKSSTSAEHPSVVGHGPALPAETRDTSQDTNSNALNASEKDEAPILTAGERTKPTAKRSRTNSPSGTVKKSSVKKSSVKKSSVKKRTSKGRKRKRSKS